MPSEKNCPVDKLVVKKYILRHYILENMCRYEDPEWLSEQYWEEGLTQREIAERCDVSTRTIRRHMKRNEIDRRKLKGENHPLYGGERSAEVKSKISETLSGRELSEETRNRLAVAHRGNEIAKEVRRKISDSLSGHTRSKKTRERMSVGTAGEDNPNWRGGYSRRYGPGWATAREAVNERDTVCQHCGHDGSESRLEVHHITPVRRFREDPEKDLREAHELENLVLLCRRCHGKVEYDQIDVPSPSSDIVE